MDWTHEGSTLSPFALKVEALLRFARLPASSAASGAGSPPGSLPDWRLREARRPSDEYI